MVLRKRIQKAMKLVRMTITPPYSAAAPQHRTGLGRGRNWGQRSGSHLVPELNEGLMTCRFCFSLALTSSWASDLAPIAAGKPIDILHSDELTKDHNGDDGIAAVRAEQ